MPLLTRFTQRDYALRNAATAYCGAFTTRNKIHHGLAVSWEGFGTDFAALVLAARYDRLKAAVYSFAAEPMHGALRTWRLRNGRYHVTVGPDADRDDAADHVAAGDEFRNDSPRGTLETFDRVEKLRPPCVGRRAQIAQQFRNPVAGGVQFPPGELLRTCRVRGIPGANRLAVTMDGTDHRLKR